MSKENNIEVMSIQSPFDRSNVFKTVLEYKGQTVRNIVDDYMPDTCNFAVSINGEVIEETNWNDTFLVPSDQLVIIPIVGDSEVFQIIALVALFVFAPQIAIALGGAGAGATVAGVTTLTTFGQFLAAGIMIGGGMLISSLGPSPSMPSLGMGADADTSQFHSFNPATKQRQGLVVPRFFGKNKIYGNVIATHTELNEDNDKIILNTLIALGKGPIKGIVGFHEPSDRFFGEVKVNKQPVENFSNVIIEHRIGTLNQDIIPFFDDTLVEGIIDLTVPFGSPVVRTTSNGNFDELEIKIGSPGIYHQADNSKLETHSIGVKIEIKETVSGSYQTLFDGVIKDNKSSTTKRTFRTIGSSITITDGDNYDIRVSKTTEDKTGVRFGDVLQFNSLSEVLTDDFIYPGLSLVGMNALATDQLSGSLNFSCIAEGLICRVWDGDAWVNEYTNNPAWVLYNVLSIPIMSGETEGNFVVDRYDGIDPSQLDTAAFYELALYCDELIPISEDDPSTLEKRFKFNGGFDSSSSVWESALVVCKMCRSALVFNGTTISVITDKPTEVTQMFGMGNIVKGSFKENFPPMSERASEIEINFLDEETDYNKTPFTIFNTSIPNNSNKVNIDLIGCTSKSQAWREGDFILKLNQYLLKTIEFQTSIDSLACQIGDVIEFSHDVPRWNQSGRTVSATSTTLTMSEDFIDENPSISENYKIIVRLSDDTLVTKTILSFVDNIITMTTPFSIVPQTDDIYQIGTTEEFNNQFRVTSITRSVEQNAKINAIEYNDLIYSSEDIGAELPTDASYIVNPDDVLVTDLRLTEDILVSESGAIQRNIVVNYDLPVSGSFYQVLIYMRIDGVTTFDLIGQTNANSFIINGVLESTDYEVVVVTQLNDLKTSAFGNSPADFITTGNNDDFSAVLLTVSITGLQVEGGSTSVWLGKDVALLWDGVPVDNPAEPSTGFWNGVPINFIQDYEVKIYDFGGSIRRTENVLEAKYTYTYENNVEDGSGLAGRNLRVEIKVRDKFGRISENPAVLTQIQNPVPAKLTDVVDTEAGTVSVISWTPSGEIDVINGGGYKLWASQTSPVDTSNDDDLYYNGPNTEVAFSKDTLGVWFYKVAAYDSFDETITTPDQFSTTLTSVGFTADYPIPTGFTWGTSVSDITWTAGTIQYKGTDFSISSGSTSSGNEYVYWDFDNLNTTFQDTDDLGTVVAADAWVIQHNDGGTPTPVNGFKIIHGGLIQADTITANQIDANTITADQIAANTISADNMAANSITAANAAIADAAITSAKIGNLEVKTANIQDLTVQTLKIDNNATRIYEFATDSSQSLTTSFSTAVTDTIVSAGNPIQITATGTMDAHTAPHAFVLQLRNGSTVLQEIGSILVTANNTQAFSITHLHTPGVGSESYNLRGRVLVDSATPKLIDTTIILDEYKGK